MDDQAAASWGEMRHHLLLVAIQYLSRKSASVATIVGVSEQGNPPKAISVVKIMSTNMASHIPPSMPCTCGCVDGSNQPTVLLDGGSKVRCDVALNSESLAAALARLL